MTKRRTFVSLVRLVDAHGKEWEIGRQDSPVGVGDEIVIFAECVACGQPVSATMTIFSASLLAHGLSDRCRHVGQVPAAVSRRALPLAKKLHDQAWKIRAEGGGSRSSTPDC